MSTLKVDGIRSNSATSDAITLADNGTCTANITNNLSNRNLIINGAMQVAQRGTSSTANGFGTIDRFSIHYDSGLTEAPTQAQVALSSSDTPYASGFRYAFKVTNGNQTSISANDYINISQKIEAQNIASSGWNYTSSSSKITLSFWVKASIAQTMYVRIEAPDASKIYSFAVAVTTSWQKITHSIVGDSSLVFNNDNGSGLQIRLIPYYGTSYTASGVTVGAWISDDGSAQLPDMANTWFSGNDATLEYTGVQLEVGSVATDFEHRSFGEDLALCQRYYQILASGNQETICNIFIFENNRITGLRNLLTEMRTTPTLDDQTSGSTRFRINASSDQNTGNNMTLSSVTSSNKAVGLAIDSLASNMTNGDGGVVRKQGSSAILGVSAEL